METLLGKYEVHKGLPDYNDWQRLSLHFLYFEQLIVVSSYDALFVSICRECQHPKYPSERNYSGPLQYRHKKDFGNLVSDNEFRLGDV